MIMVMAKKSPFVLVYADGGVKDRNRLFIGGEEFEG